MLEIKSVQWRNFMSYGDYDTILNIEDLGQCLITGDVTGSNKTTYEASENIKKSNGAGKSTIPNVILWTLFGKTMHSANPGDKVVNHFSGKDCICRIDFKNGDYIIRTRKTGGKNELIFVKDGDQTNLNSDTLSTLKNQQLMINSLFGLDWELLCGSMFFNQYSKPWMEMADGTRKKAIERALHVDRFQYRAQVSKNKRDTIERKIEISDIAIQNFKDRLVRLKESHNNIENDIKSYDESREERRKEIINNARTSKDKRDEIVKIDIPKLRAKWEIVEKINSKINDLQKDINNISRHIAESEGNISILNQKIKLWKDKSGKMCDECEQDVLESHTEDKIKPYQDDLEITEIKLKELHHNKKDILNQISKIKELLISKTPKSTLSDAKSNNDRWDAYNEDIKKYIKLAEGIKSEPNPHTKLLKQTDNEIQELNAEIEKYNKDREQQDYLLKHYHYIYKAWSDRSKIKSLIFKEHLPFINERLKYYLNVFGLDIHIELNSSLGIKSNLWGYEFESGGERKRTDVAFMLSMFDFHEQMYGRQSNILVLDEVDGRLDDDGIDSLISIIKNDLADKIPSILIISHRNMMHDTFTKEIVVKRESTDDFRGFSRLEVV